MPARKLGPLKTAAKRIGVSLEEYLSRIEKGEKWCCGCKHWLERNNFGVEKRRGDGLKTICKGCCRVAVPKSRKGRASPFKGKTHTDEAKRKMGESRKGNKNRVGAIHTDKTRLTISRNRRGKGGGKTSHLYKDGLSKIRRGLRFTPEYSAWRYEVFHRDGFTCQRCGDERGGNLNAHHIQSFADYPDLRLDVSNGITLCESCHELEHYKPDSIRNKRKARKNAIRDEQAVEN